MSYGLNGTDFGLQPTTGRWLPRTPLGISGDGHLNYSTIYQFEMRWQLASPADVSEFHRIYSGTFSGQYVTMTLPEYGAPAYQFKNYSGCTLGEPEYNVYFSENITEVVWKVNNIRA